MVRPIRRNLGKKAEAGLLKCPTGIRGLDEITQGGLPRGRTTLVCGAAGCGKTLLGMEFLVRGALEHGEPGVFMAFEESAEELEKNFASLGFDLEALTREKRISLDHIQIERSEIEETGEYDLEGLFVRLGYAIDSIGAKRVVLDTIETLFSGLSNTSILRAELRRLFRWLKQRGVTAIVTGERGEGSLTRHGLEEYVADCVILLDNRVNEQISVRRLRIVKYRGSRHGANEYPFLIGDHGLLVMPITSLGLEHDVSEGRVPTGISRLDSMLGGKGFFRGSSILVSGTAGTGKTSIASTFADAACRRGERCLYLAFEESARQIMRNMFSIGLDLGRWAKKGLLQFHNARPTAFGMETHLAEMYKCVDQFKPDVVVVDPITTFVAVGQEGDVKAMLTRLVDMLKMRQTTALFTNLSAPESLEKTDLALSSLMDTVLLLRDVETNGERNRGIYVLKSRGMAHSNQIREFLLTDKGIELIDVDLGPGGVRMGSSRIRKEASERLASLERQQEIGRRKRELESRRAAIEAKMAALRTDMEADEQELARLAAEQAEREKAQSEASAEIARARRADRDA
ncbi:MAG: circadian clock protein KaiC [bacterium]